MLPCRVAIVIRYRIRSLQGGGEVEEQTKKFARMVATEGPDVPREKAELTEPLKEIKEFLKGKKPVQVRDNRVV